MTHRHQCRGLPLVLFLLAAALAVAAPDDLVPVPLKWAPIAGAGSYRVEVQTEAGKALVTKDTVDPSLALNLAPGNYKVRISSLNRFGKVDSASPWTPMTVRKLTAPVVKSVQPPEVEEGSGFTLRVTASAEEGVIYTLEGTKGPVAPTAVRHPKADQWELDFAAADPGAFDLRAVAPSGRVGVLAGALRVRPYPAVTLTPGDPVAMVEGEALTLTVGALGVDGQTVWTLEGGPAPVVAASVARQADRWTLTFPALVPGTYTLRAVAKTGKVGEVAAQVRVEAYSEVVLQPAAFEAVEDEPLTVTVAATGVDAATRWELTGEAGPMVPTSVRAGGEVGRWEMTFASAPPVGSYGLKAWSRGGRTAELPAVLTTTRHPPVVTRVTPERLELGSLVQRELDSLVHLTLEGTHLDGIEEWTLVKSGGSQTPVLSTLADSGTPGLREVEFSRWGIEPGTYDLTALIGGRSQTVLAGALKVLHPDPVIVALVHNPSSPTLGPLQLLAEIPTEDPQVFAVLGGQAQELTVLGVQEKGLTLAVPADLAPGTYDLKLTTDEGKQTVQKGAMVWPLDATKAAAGSGLQVEANLEGMAVKLDAGPQWNLPHRFDAVTPGGHTLHIVPAFDNPKVYTGATDLAVEVPADQLVTVRALVDNQSVPVTFEGFPEGALVDWGEGPRVIADDPVTLPWGSFDFQIWSPTGIRQSVHRDLTPGDHQSTIQSGLQAMVIAYRTIAMTGQASDWEGIEPFLTESVPSGKKSMPGADVVRAWVSRDSRFFYYRISFGAGHPDRSGGNIYGLDSNGTNLNAWYDAGKKAWVGNLWIGGNSNLNNIGAILETSDGFEAKFPLAEVRKYLGTHEGTLNLGLSFQYRVGQDPSRSEDFYTAHQRLILDPEGNQPPEPLYHYRLDSLAEFPTAQKDGPGVTPAPEGTHRFLHWDGTPSGGFGGILSSSQGRGPDYSASLWVRAVRVSTGTPLLWLETRSSSLLGVLALDKEGRPAFVAGNGQWSVAGIPILGRWVSLVVTQRGQKVRLYIDGKLGAEINLAWSGNAGPFRFFLAGAGNSLGDSRLSGSFLGDLDDLRIYDRALDEAEVKRLADPTTLNASPVVKGPLAGLVTDIAPPKEGLKSPQGLAVGPDESVYVADSEANRIWRIPASDPLFMGVYAGTGSRGKVDGEPLTATLNQPWGLAMDGQGGLVFSDSGSDLIRQVGSSLPVAGLGQRGRQDAYRTLAQFNQPRGTVFDDQGNLFVADSGNHSIRKITQEGIVTTFAGTGTAGFYDGLGPADNPQLSALFRNPCGLALDESGNLYVADTGNNRIRVISIQTGSTITLAGTGSSGSTDGLGSQATFNQPTGLAFGPDGVLYVADTGNNLLRAIAPDGVVTTIAGSAKATSSFGAQVKFDGITGLAFDRRGFLFISEKVAKRVRRME